MANDYYGLMEAIQAPQRQRQQARQQQMDTIGQFLGQIGQQVIKERAQKDIEEKIKEAEASGKRVEYKIDPQTGMISPTISSQSYEGVFEALKNPEVAKNYEMGRGSKGEPRLIKKKSIKSNVISGIQSILQGDQDIIQIKNSVTGAPEDIDLSDKEQVSKALSYPNIEGGLDNPELIEAGIPKMYEIKRKKAYEAKISSAPIKDKNLFKRSQESTNPVTKKALEIQAKFPEISPKDAVKKAEEILGQKFEKSKQSSGEFKAGDIREKDGVKYIRDASGSWHPAGN